MMPRNIHTYKVSTEKEVREVLFHESMSSRSFDEHEHKESIEKKEKSEGSETEQQVERVDPSVKQYAMIDEERLKLEKHDGTPQSFMHHLEAIGHQLAFIHSNPDVLPKMFSTRAEAVQFVDKLDAQRKAVEATIVMEYEKGMKQTVQTLQNMYQIAERELRWVVNRETAAMKENRKSRNASGPMGYINRALGNDPHGENIRMASQKRDIARNAMEEKLQPAKKLISSIQTPDDIDSAHDLLSKAIKTARTNSQIDLDTDQYAAFEQQLVANRNFCYGIAAGVSGLAVSGYLITSAGASGVLAGFAGGAASGFLEGGAKSTDDYNAGKITLGEALATTSWETGKNAAIGAAVGKLGDGLRNVIPKGAADKIVDRFAKTVAEGTKKFTETSTRSVNVGDLAEEAAEVAIDKAADMLEGDEGEKA